MPHWLTTELQQEIRDVFGPKYKRPLSDEEVSEIAMNLSEVIEEILKFKWKQKYEKRNI